MQNYYLEDTVKVGDNVTIEPYAVILGETVLRDGCTVGSFSYLLNADIGQNTVVNASRIVNSKVGANCSVGPYSHLRDGAIIGDNCRVGNFVEIKKSDLHYGVKASHLAYIGDAEIGAKTNVGCGVIFVNYDGNKKHKTTVGKNCFIGCNSNLIAPVNVADNCFVACDTTVTSDVPEGAFAIGRSKMTVKKDYAKKYLKKEV